MNKGKISNILRQLRLIYVLDKLRFYIEKYKNRKVNREFKNNNPGVKLPPDYLIYESFQIHYKKYFTDSIDTANWVAGHIGKHIELKGKNILDWGCGPGRVIRHLPTVIGNDCKYYGTDYNAQSISWCNENLPGIQFNANLLEASLPYSDNFFDAIYGISIFTHLSEQAHFDWYNELYRILKPGGILFLTTQGDVFRVKLIPEELQKYDTGELVVRGKVKEGHRTFSAFHPTKFMNFLFGNAEVVEHIQPKHENTSWLPQDIWIVKK